MSLTRNQIKKNLIFFLQCNAYNKQAFDGGFFNARYTEIQTFSELTFIDNNGQLEADITKSFSYNLYYGKGKHNHAITEAELTALAKAVGIQLDPMSNFHGKLIITDADSIAILKKANVIVDKPTVSQSASHSSHSMVMSNLPQAQRITPAEVKQLHQNEDELHQLEEKFETLRKTIEAKKQEIISQKTQLNPEGPLNISFSHNTVLTDSYTKEDQELITLFFEMRKALHDKFYVKAHGVWDKLSPDNIINVRFHYAHEIRDEIKEASEFLLAIGAPIEINDDTFGYVDFKFTSELCKTAIEGLQLIPDVSPNKIYEMDHRPVMKC